MKKWQENEVLKALDKATIDYAKIKFWRPFQVLCKR